MLSFIKIDNCDKNIFGYIKGRFIKNVSTVKESLWKSLTNGNDHSLVSLYIGEWSLSV